MTQPVSQGAIDPRLKQSAANRKYYEQNREKRVADNRAYRQKTKTKPKLIDPDDVVLAPKMCETEFWDECTAPLLALFAAGPMSWADIEAGVAVLEMNPRFMHHAIAYLEQTGRIHHVGMTDVVWHYGPKPEEERP